MDQSNSTIFIVHRGPLETYAQAAILQARATDSQSSIVVLNDQPRCSTSPAILSRVYYGLLDDYATRAARFAEIFRFDPNKPFDDERFAFELLNFQRWFYILSYCEAHSLSGPFLALDSDAYLYLPMREVIPHLASAMTVVDKVGTQFTFFDRFKAVEDFTDFLTECFTTNDGYERLVQYTLQSRDAGVPHVSDMAAFGVFSRMLGLEDIGASDRTNFIFDENIGSSQGLRMNFLGKKLTIRKGRRYFTTLEGVKVIAGGVHLQGGNKVMWPYFVDPKVRTAILKSSPHDYFRARRIARKKSFEIVLLRISARVKKFINTQLTKKR